MRSGATKAEELARSTSSSAPEAAQKKHRVVELGVMRAIVRRRSRSEIAARGGAKGSRFGDGYDLKNARIILLHTTVSFPNPVMLQVPRCPLFTRLWSRISERSPSCGFSVAAHAGTCHGPSKDLCAARGCTHNGMSLCRGRLVPDGMKACCRYL